MDSIFKQKAAVVQTLNNIETIDVEFVKKDWDLMEQVIKILRPFFEVTEMLSKHDASISMAIPTVTIILDSLEENRSEDMGVLGYKRELKAEMLTMFRDMESKEHYIVSTLLDSRFKTHFFRGSTTKDEAKSLLLEKLVQLIRQVITPTQTTVNTTTGSTNVTATKHLVVGNLMQARIARSQALSADDVEVDGIIQTAQTAIDNYLKLPLSGYEEGTYKFWKNYSKSCDRGQRCLSKLARHYLTPPPTSTDIGKFPLNHNLSCDTLAWSIKLKLAVPINIIILFN